MNRILFSLLFVGVSFVGIQEAFAIKTLKPEDNTGVRRRSLNLVKTQPLNMQEKGYVPSAPAKKRHVLENKVLANPGKFYMGGGNILWQKESKDQVVVVDAIAILPKGPLLKNLSNLGDGRIKMTFQNGTCKIESVEKGNAKQILPNNELFFKGEPTSMNIPTITITLED